MTDQRSDPHPGGPPEDDERSDLEQAVEARSDALKRGEGYRENGEIADTGTGGAGGIVRNQEGNDQ